MVEALAGDVPWLDLVERYTEWAKLNRYPQRTRRAITHICAGAGVSTTACGEYVTTGYIAEVLDINVRCVQEWLRRGVLPYRQAARIGYRYVRRVDLRTLAMDRPHLFSGVSVDRLNALIEDLDLSQRIAATYPRRGNYSTIQAPRRVRCIETGQVFDTIGEAARAVYVSHQGITKALQRGWRAAGYRWEEVP
jgi:DNA-binding transcriptional MerR regulator